jgi:RNA polymerase sigma-70 factor, ECF subfamily
MTARFRPVSATLITTGDRSAEAAPTLGDLLYADRARPRVGEDEWLDLVHAIAAGDQSALHALYERTHRLVFTLIVRITGSRETAEELTLDVFHDVWRRAAQYEEHSGSVLGWIMNQARSRAIDRLRFEQRKKRVNPHSTDAVAEAAASDCEGVVALSEQGRLLQQALAVLTAQEREAIEIAFFSELTYADVAARLNQPLGTIKTRIRSGLGKLRRTLDAKVNAP